jgi:F-type H+-transporting ATPase subunit delta
VNPSLEGYAAALLGGVSAGPKGAQAMRAVATELRAVEDLVATNPSLFAGLTDTAVPAAARRAVLGDLLADKVAEATWRAAVFAAGAVSAPEVPVALAWLATRSAQLAEGDVRPESQLGHLAARRRVAGFATAVFQTLPTDSLDDIEDELFRFARTVESVPALRTALSDRDLPVQARQAVADQLLTGKVQPATLDLVRYTLVGGRPRDLVGTLDFLVEQTATARGWRVARVRAALEMDDDERDSLSQSLTRLAGSPVELQVSIDPSLLSGVLVQVGDLQLDATVRGRLDALREHLRSGSWDQPDHSDADEGADANHEEGAR